MYSEEDAHVCISVLSAQGFEYLPTPKLEAAN